MADEQVVPYCRSSLLHFKKRLTKSKHLSKGDLLIGKGDLCCVDYDENGENEWEELID